MKPYAPLGLLYLSSHLRAHGFGVEIYDSTFGSREELFRLLETERPPVVGIYGNLMTRRNVLAIATAAKANGCRVILGGPEPANYADEYLASGADAIVSGEGEVALDALLRSEDFTGVPGIQYRAPDGSIETSAFRTPFTATSSRTLVCPPGGRHGVLPTTSEPQALSRGS